MPQQSIKLIFIGTFAILLFAGIWFMFFREKREIVDHPVTGENIIFFGDSLVEGVGATPGSDMTSILSRKIGGQIINAGQSGDTTQTALVRLDKDALLKNPRIVIVLLGGNDALSKIPASETFTNLRAIIDNIHEQGAAVLLLGIRGGLLNDVYKKQFKRLSKEKKVSYIPDIFDGVFNHPDLMSDYIHPNDRGYANMAERVEPVLRKMLE